MDKTPITYEQERNGYSRFDVSRYAVELRAEAVARGELLKLSDAVRQAFADLWGGYPRDYNPSV